MINLKETKEYLEFGYKIVSCPCCGNDTLDNHFICPCCSWEYDGIVDDDTFSRSNGSTIRDYRNGMILQF